MVKRKTNRWNEERRATGLRAAVADWLAHDREVGGVRLGLKKFAASVGVSPARVHNLRLEYDEHPSTQLKDATGVSEPVKSSYQLVVERVLGKPAEKPIPAVDPSQVVAPALQAPTWIASHNAA